MSSIKTPKVTFSVIKNVDSIGNAPVKVLFIGQQLSTATATANELVQVGVSGEQINLFGKDSMTSVAIGEFRKINPKTDVWAVPLDDDAAGVKATADLIFTGTATKAGNITISIQSNTLHSYTVPIAVGDTATDIAGNLSVKIDNDISPKIFSSSESTGTVTLTCTHKGTIGNDISIYLEEAPSELGITLAVTAFNGGATDPAVDAALAAIGENRFQYIVYPYQYDLTKLKTFLDSRWNVDNDVLDGVSLIMHRVDVSGGIAPIITTADGLNTQLISLIADRFVDGASVNGKGGLWGSASMELGYINSAKITAVRTLSLVDGANVTEYMTTALNNALNSGGGPGFNVIPYHNTEVPVSTIIPKNLWFTSAELDELTDKGVATFGNNMGLTKVILGDMVTTNTKNDLGLPDTTFKYMNTVNGASYAREYFVNNNRQALAQATYSPEPRPGTPEKDIVSVEQLQTNLYIQLSDFGITPAGNDAIKFFKENLLVTVNNNGVFNIVADLKITPAVREVIGKLKII